MALELPNMASVRAADADDSVNMLVDSQHTEVTNIISRLQKITYSEWLIAKQQVMQCSSRSWPNKLTL